MTEYVKVEKIVPRFPPPAFSDIAKASNDVCLGLRKAADSATANRPPCSSSTRTSTTLPQVGETN